MIRGVVRRLLTCLVCAAFVPSGLMAQHQTPSAPADTAFVFLTPSLRHGLDTTVSPCVDFDQFVNGGWRTTFTLPERSQKFTAFHDLYHRTQYLFADLLDSARTIAGTTTDADLRVLGHYYASCMAIDSLPRELQPLSMHGARAQDSSRRLRCTRLVMHSLSDAMGQVFVRTILPPQAEQTARSMVDAVRDDILARVRRLPYLSAEATERILASLEYMTYKIMKPETMLDHTGLTLSPTDFVSNRRTVDQFVSSARIRQKDSVRRVSWMDKLYNPNAHYNPATNSIEIPASLFQWPFFDANGDLSMAYAAVGFVVGHEILHNVTTRLWTEDREKMDDLALPLVKHYSSLPGMQVDGGRTLFENLSDLGGLLASYDAWARTARSSAVPLIEGFTPDQRFFLYYARIWREKGTPTMSDPHAPGPARINGVVMNVPAFAEAFGCREGDAMAKSAAERVDIW